MVSVQISEKDVEAAIPGAQNIEVLGAGGQKSVFKCDLDGHTYAIKFIQVAGVDDNGDAQDDIAALKRATRELETNERLGSRFMPRLGGIPSGTYDKNEGRFFFYSEEYLPGPTLHELIAKGVFDADALVKLAGDITTALDALWTQTNQVHRDVKPRNIIRRDDTGDYALIDAGIALALEETSLTPSGLVMGTLRYCSPEQIQGRKRALDIRSDFYALGIVLFEAATGHHPYCAARQSDPEIVQHILRTRPPALESIRADLPPELSKLVDCLLAKQSYLRPKTGADLLLTLRALGYS